MSKIHELINKEPAKEDFYLKSGEHETQLFFLSNSSGIRIGITNYGARIVSLLVPDSAEKRANVVLGYNSIDEYMKSEEPYFGATVGRYANRIADGAFYLDNSKYRLDINDMPNHLHGGTSGFHREVWEVLSHNNSDVIFRHISKDGESGYPGNLAVTVTFKLNDKSELRIDYSAVTDSSTIINLTNHAYFNLTGAGSGSITQHKLTLNADFYTPINKRMIPTGELEMVADSPFDFRTEKPIGRDWDLADEQLKIADGYDHNFVLNGHSSHRLKWAARVKDPISGRELEIETTEPGIQFYTANSLTGSSIGREGIHYQPRTAFCLETQHFPDSPNNAQFPEVVLRPGDTFSSSTIYRFSW